MGYHVWMNTTQDFGISHPILQPQSPTPSAELEAVLDRQHTRLMRWNPGSAAPLSYVTDQKVGLQNTLAAKAKSREKAVMASEL